MGRTPFLFLVLGLASGLCILGLAVKVSIWTGNDLQGGTSHRRSERMRAALRGAMGVLFSRRIGPVLKALFLDGFLGRRVLQESVLRWLIHSCLFWGFVALFVVHPIGTWIAGGMDRPSLALLRDLFGVLILLGVVLALYRRFVGRVPYVQKGRVDVIAIALLASMVLSGLFVEGLRILSKGVLRPGDPRFARMVEEFAGELDTQAVADLNAFWLQERTIVSAGPPGTDGETERGERIYRSYCTDCHDAWPGEVAPYAFAGYRLARIIGPLPGHWQGLRSTFWYVHLLFVGLFIAYLPYGKFFHMIAGPLSLMAGAVPPKDPLNRSTRELIELDACTRCGECMRWCPAYGQKPESILTPMGKIEQVRTFLRDEQGLRVRLLGPRMPKAAAEEMFSQGVFECTLCARCQAVCPVGIGTRSLMCSMREGLVRSGHFPEHLNAAKGAVLTTHNVLNYPNEERLLWAEYMDDVDDDLYQRDRAEVLYYVGCMSSFSPAIQEVPQAMLRVLQQSGLDFALLGGEEWCCGFPLMVAGMLREAEVLKQHHVVQLGELGVSTVVFNCPSCYYMWSTYYGLEGIELVHSTTFIAERIRTGTYTPPLQDPKVVTYHDPCDLGRGMGIYDAPREILRGIEGVEFVELPYIREKGYCCGGGGDLEMFSAALGDAIALDLVREARKTGAEILVSACPQCKRMIRRAIEADGAPIQVMDIAELAIGAWDGR